ncbi:MAG: hypothetical protein PHE88_12310 [Elusimicrobia bacterium]|nr:hypothetical protein [Elusimicrobiota bacterium]
MSYDILRKEGNEYVKTDSVNEGENRLIKGKDGRNHVGSIRIKRVKCGKKCKKCPHAAFAYLQYRDGDKVTEKYIGKVA